MPQQNYNGRIVLVESNQDSRDFWEKFFINHDFRVSACENFYEMKESLDCYFVDAVLVNIEPEQEHKFEGVSYVISNYPYTKVFVISGDENIGHATKAIKMGATDYFVTNACPELILNKIINSFADDQTRLAKLSSDEFIGQSNAHLEVCSKIDQIKDVDSTVLILGESGTGKEVVARTLHRKSKRCKKRFEGINCGAIPEQLLESELFGHKKGAFTDATDDRKGIFEICSEGTLLLDEIGDMPLSLQVKLLRVLEEKRVTPIGSSKSIEINTRVIAATHRNLKERVQQGEFREDLYYRLSVIPIEVPSLRERREDIPLLVNSFISKFNEKFDKKINPITQELSERLKSYDWPGNIRELKNSVERAVVLSQSSDLDIEALFSQSVEKRHNDNSGGTAFNELFQAPLTEAKQIFEKMYIENLLKETQGNISEAAKKCGRYRSDIYRLFEKYDIDHRSFR